MKAIVFAYSDIGCEGIRQLLATGIEIAAVFTHVDDPKENRFFDSVAQLAAEHNLPTYAPADVNHPLWVERIRDMAPSAIFSFYYRHLLCAEILDIPPQGAFNLHGSLLPRYRGRAPANWVLVKGERETGVTLHKMVAKPDAGPIAAQQSVAICWPGCCQRSKPAPRPCSRKTKTKPAALADAAPKTANFTGIARPAISTIWSER